MNDRFALAAGLFILLSIGLVMFILVQIADTGMFEQKTPWTVRFPAGNDLQGLREDSPVRIFGIEVGTVSRIEIQPGEAGDAAVDVHFALPEEYLLREGAEVTVQSGLTGGALLYIETLGEGQPLDPTQPVMGQAYSLAQVFAALGQTLPTVRTAVNNGNQLILKVTDKVDPLTGQVAGVLEKADAAVTYVRDLLGDTSPDLRQTITNVRDFTGNANDLVDGQNKGNLSETFANVKDLTGTARTKLPDTIDSIKEAFENANTFVTQAKQSFDTVDQVMDNAKVATAQLRTAVAENRPKIDRAMTNVQRGTEHFEAGLAEIRAAPWRLLNKPDDVDEHNLVVYAAARELAHGAADLEATAATLEALAADPNADPQRLEQLRQDLIRKYQDLAQTQDEIWSQYRNRR